MLDQQYYVREKLHELDAARRARPQPPHRRAPRPLAPMIRGAGSGVRRLGEALERWAAPPIPHDATG